MMTHGVADARGVTETDSDTVSYRQHVLARRGAGVVLAARLTSAIPAHKSGPPDMRWSAPGGLNTGGTSSHV
jgi:hypothetical protein